MPKQTLEKMTFVFVDEIQEAVSVAFASTSDRVPGWRSGPIARRVSHHP